METQNFKRDYYITYNNNIYNPYLQCLHTIDGKFIRMVDNEEADYLKERLDIYQETEEIIEPKYVPGVWTLLFELQDCDYKDYHVLVFTKKTEKRRYYKFLYVPTKNLSLGYIRIDFKIIGYKPYNSDHKKLSKFINVLGSRINYNGLLRLVKEFSKEENLQNNLITLKNLKL